MKFPPLKGSALAKIGIGVVAGLVVVVGGFLLVQNVFTKASDSAPRDLIINDITTNSAKLSWTTDQETQGVIEYGSSPTSLNLFAPESQKQKNHTVEVTLLSPATSYYFQIRIGDTKFDNGGVPWTFSTKLTAQPTGTQLVATPSASPAPTLAAVVGEPTPESAIGPLKSSTLRVVPTSRQVINTPTAVPYVVPTLPIYVCGETDCQKICQKIGSTCSTENWMDSGCVGKYVIGSCAIAPTITPSPTVTPTPTVTSTPTPTATSTPSPTPTP
jgi:hypothetical protein